MRILLTGGAGFIGRHVIDALDEAGFHDLVAYDSWEPLVHGDGPPPERITGFSRPVEVPMVPHNITNEVRLLRAVRDADIIVHLAAGVSVGASFDNPAPFVRDNSYGTAMLWHCIRQRELDGNGKPQHVVNFSSMAIYGHGLEGVGLHELTVPNPVSVYGLSKWQAEQLCTLGSELYGVPVTNLRLWNCYGPGQSLNNAETGAVAIFASAMLQKKPVTVFEDGRQLRDFVYVTDVARAVVLAIQRRLIEANPHNPVLTVHIGTGMPTSVQSIAERIAKATDEPIPIPNGKLRPGDARHCWPLVLRAERELGFEAEVSLDEGLDLTVTWARQQTKGGGA